MNTSSILVFLYSFSHCHNMTPNEDNEHLTTSGPKQMLGWLLPRSPRPAFLRKDEWCVTPQEGLLLFPSALSQPALSFFLWAPLSYFSITVIVQVFIIFLAPPLKFKHHENIDVFLVHGYIHNAWHLNMSESVKVNMGSEGGEVAREKAGALRGFQSAHESLPLSPSWTTVILRMQSTASRSSRGQSHFTVAHRRARQMSFSKWVLQWT